jgi:hypothetical protein
MLHEHKHLHTSLGLAVCYIIYIDIPPSSLLRILRKWYLKITGGKMGKWQMRCTALEHSRIWSCIKHGNFVKLKWISTVLLDDAVDCKDYSSGDRWTNYYERLVQWHLQTICEEAPRAKTVPEPLCPPQTLLRIKPGSPPSHAVD